MSKSLPLVALVGRPNVGKSTLFNRLIGKRRALVKDQPGVTRDLNYGECFWTGYGFRVVDMGGLDFDVKDGIEEKMASQALLGISEADLLIVMMDIRSGVTLADHEWIRRLRKLNKPQIYVLNKADSKKDLENMLEFYELGVDNWLAIAAEKGSSVGDLLEEVVSRLKDQFPQSEVEDEITDFKLSIIGRPNVGKSTLLNHILGEKRSIVSNVPGTTRDPVNSFFEYDEENYCLIDTAGIRRRGRIDQVIEKFSVIKSIKSIEDCDCALLLIDGIEGVTDQDAHILGEAFKRNKATILIVNKWDEANQNMTQNDFLIEIERKLTFSLFSPILFISALTGKNVNRIFPLIKRVKSQLNYRVPTGELNREFEKIVNHHPLPVHRGKNVKIYYITQAGINPPKFLIFTNHPKHIHFSYERYLVNAIRERFNFKDVPIQIVFKGRK